MKKQFSRRDFLKVAGGAAFVVAGASVLPQFLRRTLLPEQVVGAAGNYDLFFGGTDGWFFMPPTPTIPPWHPDTYAPDPFTTYLFGFRNLIPFFDGEPTGSVAVPVGQLFTYVFRPHDPGTYMYHCHVEDVEHVTMGMTSLVFVRPFQNGTPYVYQGKT